VNGGAKDHGHDAAKFRCQGVGGHATEAIGTAPETLILLRLMLARLPGVIMMIVTVRGRLLGRDQMEPSMGVAAESASASSITRHLARNGRMVRAGDL
jgi:hypothetical protein